MLYNGKSVEVLGTKRVFGEEIAWIRILENNEFRQVAFENLNALLQNSHWLISGL